MASSPGLEQEEQEQEDGAGPLLSWLDYLVFCVLLVLGLLIGVVLAIRKQQGPRALFLGGQALGVLPIWVSLYMSYHTASDVLATPGRVYLDGAGLWVGLAAAAAAIALCIVFYVPVVHRLVRVSVFEYLEVRFNRLVRVLASLLYCITTTVWMAAELYIPAVAFNHVCGLSMWLSILAVGIICTIYTTLGGLKAVVWTSMLQALVLCGSAVAIAVVGTLAHGGLLEVWDTAQEGDKLNFFVWDSDPRKPYTFWSCLFGDLFLYLFLFGACQQATQRYVALPSLAKARMSLLLVLPTLVIGQALYIYLGLLAYTQYQDCDPLKSGRLTDQNQLLPKLVVDLFGNYRAVVGVVISGFFGATLSTLSAGQNAVAAVIQADFLKPCYETVTTAEMSDRAGGWVARTLTVMAGLVTVALACVGSYLGDDVIRTCSCALAIVGGPLLGVFTLGMFFPCANSFGALMGLLSGIGLIVWLSVGAVMAPYNPVAMALCGANLTQQVLVNGSQPDTATLGYSYGTGLASNQTGYPFSDFQLSLSDLYQVSYRWYPVIGTLFTVFLGLVFSVMTGGCCRQQTDPRVLYSCREHCCGKKTYYYNVQQHEKEADYTYLPMTAQQLNMQARR